MAKRARKQRTEAERAEIERDRLAAHGISDSAGQNAEANEVEEQTFPEAVVKAFEQFEGDGEGDAINIEVPSELEATEGEPFVGDDEEPKEPNSIVKDKFKVKYIENAKAQGATSKAAKRSNWDWLSQQLAAACLTDKGKIEIGAFTDILDANGVDHSRWTNKNKGWEGRFRMTGRVALQKVVANNGKLLTPGGTEIEAPTEWCAIYKTKA